ncbi:hypothetical protein GCM10027091_62320 [Streptomyces daliensis]
MGNCTEEVDTSEVNVMEALPFASVRGLEVRVRIRRVRTGGAYGVRVEPGVRGRAGCGRGSGAARAGDEDRAAPGLIP